jgi:hypothetical protein
MIPNCSEDVEGKISDLMSRVLNSEPRCVTVAFGLSTNFQSRREIYRKINSIADSWVPQSVGYKEYCGSFREVSIVKENAELEPNTKWSLTDFGRTIARPLAVLGLDLCSNTKLSLNHLFGYARKSKGKTIPYKRLRMIEVMEEGMRKTDIMKSAGMHLPNEVINYLRTLSETGFIEYESLCTAKGENYRYNWLDEAPLEGIATINASTQRTQAIARVCFERKDFCIEYLVSELGLEEVEKYRSNINKILRGLIKQKRIERIGEIGGMVRSRFTFTPRMKLLKDFAYRVRSVVEDNERHETMILNHRWKLLHLEEENLTQLVSYCLNKHHESSPVRIGLSKGA